MGTSDGMNPIVHRRRLCTELRRIRQQTNQTHEQVAGAMDWALSKLIRIENGYVGISTNDLKLLLGHYGIVDDNQVDELTAIAKAARKRPWWWEGVYSNVAPLQLLEFIGYQTAAMITRNYEPLLIPDLLQTEEYAREVIKEFSECSSESRLNSLVALRIKRQELLKCTGPPPWFFFILDEGVLRRLIGSGDVMGRQVRYLIELAGKDNVSIEVLPFSAGVHRGMEEPFVILEFPEAEDCDVVYLENQWVRSADGGTYREIFEELRHLSLGEGSVEFLRGLLNEIK
jgi:hypothetical protein